MPVFRLTDANVFPPPEYAEPDGLLAIGGDLSPQRLLLAYGLGIFPLVFRENPYPVVVASPAPGAVSGRIQSLRQSAARGKERGVPRHDRHAFPGSHAAMRAGSREDSGKVPGSRRKCWMPIACSTASASRIRWKPGRTANWSADSTEWPSGEYSSGESMFMRKTRRFQGGDGPPDVT